MKKILVAIQLLLVSHAGYAITLDRIPGYDFDAIANTVLDSQGTFSTNWATFEESITDTNTATYVMSAQGETAYLDLGFSANVYDTPGIDLSIFFVFDGGHTLGLTLFDDVSSSGQLYYDNVAYTGYNVIDTDNPIYVMDIDLADFGFLGEKALSKIRLDVSNQYAVPSFVGAYNTAVVPVPAAVWLFGSGLLGLVSIARRRR